MKRLLRNGWAWLFLLCCLGIGGALNWGQPNTNTVINIENPAFGAHCDGVTDDSAAAVAALAALPATGGTLLQPADCPIYLAGNPGVNVPYNVIWKGDAGFNGAPPGGLAGARIICPSTASSGTWTSPIGSDYECVQFGNTITQSLEAGGMENVAISRTGGWSPTSNNGDFSKCVTVYGGGRIHLSNVSCTGFDIGFYLYGSVSSSTRFSADYIYTGGIGSFHFVDDGYTAPFLRDVGFGSLGTSDSSKCRGYILITDTFGNTNGAGGPNTLNVVHSIFNQGNGTTCNHGIVWAYFKPTHAGSVYDWFFVDTHVEALYTGGGCTDAIQPCGMFSSDGSVANVAGNTDIARVHVSASDVNAKGAANANLLGGSFNTCTSPCVQMTDWTIENLHGAISLTLQNGAPVKAFKLANSQIVGAASFTGFDSTSSISLIGDKFSAGLTLAGTWADIDVLAQGGGGPISNSATATNFSICYNGSCQYSGTIQSLGIVGGNGTTNAQAGLVGEFEQISCQSDASSSLTISSASPAVWTWASSTNFAHAFSGPVNYNWTCPVALITGGGGGGQPANTTTYGTTYWIIGLSLSGNCSSGCTFYTANSPGNALACLSSFGSCTGVTNNTGAAIGAGTGNGYAVLSNTGNTHPVAGLIISAGNWDCTSTVEFLAGSGTTSYTQLIASVNNASGSIGTLDQYTAQGGASEVPGSTGFANILGSPQFRLNSNISQNVFANSQTAFTSTTPDGAGSVTCLRLR